MTETRAQLCGVNARSLRVRTAGFVRRTRADLQRLMDVAGEGDPMLETAADTFLDSLSKFESEAAESLEWLNQKPGEV